MLQHPELIVGANHKDERGVLSFVNDFNFPGVKRFYQVANSRLHFVRAWQGHSRGARFIYAAAGAALVAAVRMPAPGSPIVDAPEQFLLTADNPAVLWIPPGYANGWMNLTSDASLFFFSTTSLEENRSDDIRFPPDQPNIWQTDRNAFENLNESRKL